MAAQSKTLLRAGLGLLGLVWVLGLPAHAGNPPIQAPSASSGKTAQTAHLGKINVTAMKKLVQTLQQVKVALNRPFTDRPKDVDQMVCHFQAGALYGEPSLACGTQGWYSMRRTASQLAWMTGAAAVPTLGHPWHRVRQLNYRQLMYLRKLLKALPPPGKGEVVVVDKTGKPILTVKH